ncbi:MAG: cation transporter [Saprospiraceae bacterium]|nr:cation transporter [Saprospiraceae bacterium]
MRKEISKLSVQKWILIVSILVFSIKMAAYFYTMSIGILSDALESTINVFTGFMTYFSLRYSFKPKDIDHPYGHGKIELITASIEGLLIAIAGFYIIYEAIVRFYQPSEIQNLSSDLVLIAFCGLINYILAVYSIKTGEKFKSMALVAGGQHLKTDTYTSGGLILGLSLVLITGITWIDSLVAIVFGLIIWKGAYDILRHTTMGLMDKVDVQKLDDLVKELAGHKKNEWIYVHKLTLLHFGNNIHLDLHLTLPYYFTLQESLQEVKEIKKIIIQHIDNEQTDISIQTEPCHQDMCRFCSVDCPVRMFAYEKELPWETDLLTSPNIFKQSGVNV